MANWPKMKRRKWIKNFGLLLLIVSGYIVTFGILSSNTGIDHSVDKNLYYEQQEKWRIQKLFEQNTNIICLKNQRHLLGLTLCRYNETTRQSTASTSSEDSSGRNRLIWQELIRKYGLQYALVFGETDSRSTLYFAALGVSVLSIPVDAQSELLLQSSIMHNSMEHLVQIYADQSPIITQIMRLSRDKIDMTLIDLNNVKCEMLSFGFMSQFPTNFRPLVIQVIIEKSRLTSIACFPTLSSYLLSRGYKTNPADPRFQGFWFHKNINKTFDGISK